MSPVTNLDDSVIGANVKAARNAAGMSQQALADYLSDLVGEPKGWTQRTILRIEQGERPIRLVEAMVIATALEVSLADLTAGLDVSIEAMVERGDHFRRTSALGNAIALISDLGPDELASLRAALVGVPA